MNFKRLYIKNFGPIREIELHFEQNKVYHFIADNDSGKSMVIDAMNFLCNNVADLHAGKYISDYAENFYIEGEDFNGNIVCLNRGKDSWYKLIRPDGKEKMWDKLRGKVPEEIQRIVNVYKDTVKDEKFNFRYADDKILFMNTTPGENYSYFQKALGTDEVIMKLRKANTMENDLVDELEKIESKLDYEKEKLNNTPDITHIKEELSMYKKSVENTMKTVRLLHEVKGLKEKQEMIEKKTIPTEILDFDKEYHRNLIFKIKIMRDIISSNDKIKDIEKQDNLLVSIKGDYAIADGSNKIIKLINNIDGSKTKEKITENVCNKYKEIQEDVKTLKKGKKELEDISKKLNSMKFIEENKVKEKNLCGIEEELKSLKDGQENTKTIMENISRLKSLIGGLEQLKEENSKLETHKKYTSELENKLNRKVFVTKVDGKDFLKKLFKEIV